MEDEKKNPANAVGGGREGEGGDYDTDDGECLLAERNGDLYRH